MCLIFISRHNSNIIVPRRRRQQSSHSPFACPATTCRPTVSILMNEWHVLADDDDDDCTSDTLTGVRSPRAEHGTERPRGERGVRTVLARSSGGGYFSSAPPGETITRDAHMTGVLSSAARNVYLAFIFNGE